MESNGIIRRIDDLGRIVIPREYRKLYGIDLGDPMEIRAISGDILIKKVDISGELIKTAQKVVSAALKSLYGTVLLFDKSGLLFAWGQEKQLFGDMQTPRRLLKIMSDRTPYLGGEEREGEIVGLSLDRRVLAYPCHGGADCYGLLVFVSQEKASETEQAVLSLCASVIGEYMQKY